MDGPLCRGAEADPDLERLQVWENDLWRLTMSLSAEVYGFSYLDSKRHITDFTTLDGTEAATFGPVLSRVSRMLREESGPERVVSKAFPALPEAEHRRVAERVQSRLEQSAVEEE